MEETYSSDEVGLKKEVGPIENLLNSINEISLRLNKQSELLDGIVAGNSGAERTERETPCGLEGKLQCILMNLEGANLSLEKTIDKF